MQSLLAWGLVVVTRLLALLPFSATRPVGRLLSRAARVFDGRAAQITRFNIGCAYADLDPRCQRALCTESLDHTGRLVAESGIVFHGSPARIERLVKRVENLDALERPLATGRGVLLLVPHYGNWEFLALYLGRFNLTALYDPPRVAALEGMIRAARQRTGATLLPISGAGLRRVYRTLDSGGLVGILPDQVPARDAGCYAPFFGRPALTMKLAHRLILKTHPEVLLATAHRSHRGFDIRFIPVDERIHANGVEDSVAALNEAVEKLVRQDPAQYQWEYKRFKKPPPGIPDLYTR